MGNTAMPMALFTEVIGAETKKAEKVFSTGEMARGMMACGKTTNVTGKVHSIMPTETAIRANGSMTCSKGKVCISFITGTPTRVNTCKDNGREKASSPLPMAINTSDNSETAHRTVKGLSLGTMAHRIPEAGKPTSATGKENMCGAMATRMKADGVTD